MARTYRDKLIVTYRERRELANSLPVGAYTDQHTNWTDERYFQKLKGGDMVMSPSTSGVWDDCRASDSAGRKAQRRLHKRRERQNWKRELLID
jgi:hypothetical protein